MCHDTAYATGADDQYFAHSCYNTLFNKAASHVAPYSFGFSSTVTPSAACSSRIRSMKRRTNRSKPSLAFTSYTSPGFIRLREISLTSGGNQDESLNEKVCS